MPAKTENSVKGIKTRKNPAKGAVILKAAEQVFARKGFHEATMADIARKAQVSEATIYDYFSSKVELLFSIPAKTIREYQEKNLEILEYFQGAANKLRFLIYRHLKLYASNPDYANVVMLILKGNRNFLKTEAYKIVQRSARNTTQVLKEGIQSGEFRPHIDPHLVRAMIWGTIEHLVTRKSLLGKPEDLLGLADDIVNTIFNGILNPRKDATIQVEVQLQKADERGKNPEIG
ncbi:MAG: TetR/AcrR family transcriptional regulator [Desulfobacterales bacterium]|jgi:TetR/AcrR family fatty acid metabolism transcriptional regulator